MKQHFLLYRSTKINVRLHPTTSPRLVGEAGPSLKSSPKPRTGFTEFFYPKQPSPKQYNAFCLCSGKRRNYPSLILYLNVFTINLCPKIVSNLKTCKSRTTSPNLREADPGGLGACPQKIHTTNQTNSTERPMGSGRLVYATICVAYMWQWITVWAAWARTDANNMISAEECA
jgi:hypothetical protein